MLPAVDIARVCHEANRALQTAIGDPDPSPTWDEAPEWQRASAVEGVEVALTGATPEELHESWSDAKRSDGWTYGPVKNGIAKTHPCLVDYADLPEHQRVKDDLFAVIVEALGEVQEPSLDLDGRHPGMVELLRWLTPNPHLTGHAAVVAGWFGSTARVMVSNLPDGPELTAGLRKLLEAKDCFVRAAR